MLWLQSCIKALLDANLDNNKLNLFFFYAVNINNKLFMRISVKDVTMQSSVWSSLKRTKSKDWPDQTAIADESFIYCYKGDPEVPIGILSFLDDTLGVSESGNAAIHKDAPIHSFIETQQLKLSKYKSVIIHV